MIIKIDSKNVPNSLEICGLAKECHAKINADANNAISYLAYKWGCAIATVKHLVEGRSSKDVSFRLAIAVMSLHRELFGE